MSPYFRSSKNPSRGRLDDIVEQREMDRTSLTWRRGAYTKREAAALRLVFGISSASSRRLSADGTIPNGNFWPDNAQLKLVRNNADNANPNGGFRLEMRDGVTEILLRY
jgi:hypothetical protein